MKPRAMILTTASQKNIVAKITSRLNKMWFRVESLLENGSSKASASELRTVTILVVWTKIVFDERLYHF